MIYTAVETVSVGGGRRTLKKKSKERIEVTHLG